MWPTKDNRINDITIEILKNEICVFFKRTKSIVMNLFLSFENVFCFCLFLCLLFPFSYFCFIHQFKLGVYCSKETLSHKIKFRFLHWKLFFEKKFKFIFQHPLGCKNNYFFYMSFGNFPSYTGTSKHFLHKKNKNNVYGWVRKSIRPLSVCTMYIYNYVFTLQYQLIIKIM